MAVFCFQFSASRPVACADVPCAARAYTLLYIYGLDVRNNLTDRVKLACAFRFRRSVGDYTCAVLTLLYISILYTGRLPVPPEAAR